jgi:AmiR/NasT family two-component response regulator
MSVDDRPLGALNLYAREVGVFNAHHQTVAQLFASHAAVVLANAEAYREADELSRHLTDAMESRASIEQAKGILMAAQRCSPDEAFALLVAASQRENLKLREIARRIVSNTMDRSGESPPSDDVTRS